MIKSNRDLFSPSILTIISRSCHCINVPEKAMMGLLVKFNSCRTRFPLTKGENFLVFTPFGFTITLSSRTPFEIIYSLNTVDTVKNLCGTSPHIFVQTVNKDHRFHYHKVGQSHMRSVNLLPVLMVFSFFGATILQVQSIS